MKSLLTILLFLLTLPTFAQDYHSEFLQHCETQDTLSQLRVLRLWEKESPQDAELFTSYFNYHFAKSKKEVMSLTTEAPAGKALVMKDSTGEAKGWLASTIHYDETEFQKGIDRINQGIELYPDRLDMRFGKIYSYGQKEDWENFTSTILETIRYSDKNNNQWTWTNNEPYGEGEKGFVRSLQDYQYQLYNTGDDELLKNMRTIAQEILKYYPEDVPSLSNISITYLLTDQYDNALESLLKAESIDPKDHIVLSNIAHTYKLKGDTVNSIAYYKKIATHEDQRVAQFAKKQIELLSK